ncbi:MAG: FG-GAP-like repeat-containing protein [Anaerolineae bacterium]|nr:FG-GAP-like repeat-containing protein [Anaerolineae bacterium]
MRHSFWRMASCALALIALLLSATPVTPVGVAQAGPIAPTPSVAPAGYRHDQVVTLTTAGQIVVTDVVPQPGMVVANWNSGNDTGWEYLAAGAFKGSSNNESIVAIGGNRLKVFDPFPPPGQTPVTFERTLEAGYYERITTGDFNGDGYDDIAATVGVSNPYRNRLYVYDVRNNTQLYYEEFGATWQAITAGDFNGDRYDDLAMVRNPSGASPLLKVYNGRTWSPLAESTFNYPWITLAAGRLSSPNLPDQLALLRTGVLATLDSLIMFNVSAGGFSDVFPGQAGNFRYYPNFTSLALGDLAGNGYHEIFLLRDPVEAGRVGLLMVSPAITPPRWIEIPLETGANAWRQVRTGDLNGDGRDEVVILRGDRFRAYTQMWQNDTNVEVIGNFRVPPIGTDWPVMVLANLDGAGIPAGPTLNVSPASLAFNLNYGEPSPTKTLSITNVGTSAALPWQAQVTAGATWLRLDKTQGTTPDQLGVSVVSTTAPGTYTGNIRITATDGTVRNSPVDIPVTLQITGVGLLVSPTILNFDVAWGDPGSAKAVVINAGGASAVNWTAEILAGASWLRINTTAGTTPATLYVSVDTVAAGPGTHQGVIKIAATDPQVANSPQYVTVNLTVPDPGFVLYPSQVNIWQQIGAAAVTKEIQVLRPASPTQWVAAALPLGLAAGLPEKLASGAAHLDKHGLTVDGQAVTPPAWLVFAPDSGTTPSTITVSVAPTATVPGVYRAAIVAAAQDARVDEPVRIVTVTAVLADRFYSLYLPMTIR